MAITLQKPLGTDIYDIDVFNSNFNIIETYLNQLISGSTSGLKVYTYPGTSDMFNIDTAITGIHVCNNLDISNLSGTYPGDNNKWYFEVLSILSDTTASVQQYIDMTEEHNKLFIRSKLPNSTWTAWSEIGSGGGGGGGTTSGIEVMYVSSLNVDTTDSGIYMCDGATITGILPTDLSSTKLIQVMSYGNGDNVAKTQIITNLANGENKTYSRVKYKNTAGNFVWSDWQVGSGGGSNIEVSIISFDE